MLKKINFDVYSPLAYDYLSLWIVLNGLEKKAFQLGKFYLDVSGYDYHLCTETNPMHVAAAAIVLAKNKMLNPGDDITDPECAKLEFHVADLDLKKVQNVAKKLLAFLLGMKKEGTSSIFKKYDLL